MEYILFACVQKAPYPQLLKEFLPALGGAVSKQAITNKAEKTECNINFIWTKAGTIYMKKTDTSVPMIITSMQELNKVQ